MNGYLFRSYKKYTDLKDCISYKMGFQSKYQSDEERQKARREQKNRHSSQPYEYKLCEVTIMLGNKWKHEKTIKHTRNEKKTKQTDGKFHNETQ